ncbi:hypothetical protein LV779_21820 [Streptomyces thinghirensis]|nr:hypothetical protein [Streptomyces thinghirensis]
MISSPQISNALFRDGGLGFKAKGIFGYISTHRSGWQVTVADLVRCGSEGRRRGDHRAQATGAARVPPPHP